MVFKPYFMGDHEFELFIACLFSPFIDPSCKPKIDYKRGRYNSILSNRFSLLFHEKLFLKPISLDFLQFVHPYINNSSLDSQT